MSEYKNIICIQRQGREIVFFLKDGEDMNIDNIYDVQIFASFEPETLLINNFVGKTDEEKS